MNKTEIVKNKSRKKPNVLPEEVERIETSQDFGLTDEQVAVRVEAGMSNKTIKTGTKSIPMIILGNLLTYYNLLFAIIAAALIIERSFNNLTFLVVIIANIIIGTVQEINSKLTLDKLNLVTAPQASVVRNGAESIINSEDIVVDDIVIFSSGQQIYADAVVVFGDVQVNESLVTGESDEIAKHAGDQLLSGSFIISGKCRARVERVGKDSFASKLSLDAKKIKKKQHPGMMRSLTLLVKIIGIIIIPFGVIMFLNQTQHMGLDSKQAVESTAAAMIGMIPEGLYLLTSVALAASVMRLAKKRTLVHDLKCIEALARVDVLCVDKTGTITEDKMEVKEVVPLDKEKYDTTMIEKIIADFTSAMNSDNATMTSLKERFEGTEGQRRIPLSVIGFSSSTKYSAVSFSQAGGFVLGAPEFILKNYYQNWMQVIESRSSRGERVLLLAGYNAEYLSQADIFNGGTLDPAFVKPIALVTLLNRIRPEARATFDYFAKQGVTVKVISGDNPLTVSETARQAGVLGAEKYIDASKLDTYEKASKAILEYNVFGRVTPDQKRQFVRALKKAGHTVAMTGDGVNDVLALKDSDCSVAMASGSDAACNVSDLVLLDSNFSAMPAVVSEGRRVINNIERSAALFLVKNIFSFVMAFAAIFIPFAYPFTPSQLSLVNMMMIGIPSFFLALAPNKNKVTGKFLTNVIYRAFPAALTDIFVVTGVLLFGFAFDIPYAQTSTVAVVLFGIVGWVLLYRVCKPFCWWKWILWGSMGGLFVLSLFLMHDFFELCPLSLGSVLVAIVFLLLIYPAINVVTRSLDFINKLVKKIIAKVKEKTDE
ncbi:MAG: HAD-IC family P-type ATPase [Firmicutes bacterium]|nr:HAD-IC family P-type ATPase [Bacillota bacterium]